MSFLGPLADLASSAVEQYGASYVRSMLPSILRSGIDSGYSGAEMLRQLRSVGAGINTQRFYQTLGEVQASDISGANAAGRDLTDIPSEGDFADWGVSNPRGYVYQFRTYIGEHVEQGQMIPTGYRDFSVRTLSIQNIGEITQDALDVLRDNAGNYGQTILGIELVNLYKEVGI